MERAMLLVTRHRWDIQLKHGVPPSGVQWPVIRLLCLCVTWPLFSIIPGLQCVIYMAENVNDHVVCWYVNETHLCVCVCVCVQNQLFPPLNVTFWWTKARLSSDTQEQTDTSWPQTEIAINGLLWVWAIRTWLLHYKSFSFPDLTNVFLRSVVLSRCEGLQLNLLDERWKKREQSPHFIKGSV